MPGRFDGAINRRQKRLLFIFGKDPLTDQDHATYFERLATTTRARVIGLSEHGYLVFGVRSNDGQKG